MVRPYLPPTVFQPEGIGWKLQSMLRLMSSNCSRKVWAISEIEQPRPLRPSRQQSGSHARFLDCTHRVICVEMPCWMKHRERRQRKANQGRPSIPSIARTTCTSTVARLSLYGRRDVELAPSNAYARLFVSPCRKSFHVPHVLLVGFDSRVSLARNSTAWVLYRRPIRAHYTTCLRLAYRALSLGDASPYATCVDK